MNLLLGGLWRQLSWPRPPDGGAGPAKAKVASRLRARPIREKRAAPGKVPERTLPSEMQGYFAMYPEAPANCGDAGPWLIFFLFWVGPDTFWHGFRLQRPAQIYQRPQYLRDIGAHFSLTFS